VEGAFGSIGLVAGPFDGELGGPTDPVAPVASTVDEAVTERLLKAFD
jgi:hypothetical protein